MTECTQLEFKIPCNGLSTSDIPRILLNLRTWLESECPEPIMYHLTNYLDTGIMVSQCWPISEAGETQGGPDMFRVCPADIGLNVARWQRSIIRLDKVIINDESMDNSVTVGSIYQKQLIMAHNITTRRKFGVHDSGGGFLGTDCQGFHRQRYISWLFTGLDVNRICGGLYGCQIEVREYLAPLGVDKRVSFINNKRVFNVILYVPVANKKDADEKITMFNKIAELKQLLHRLCYICTPT